MVTRTEYDALLLKVKEHAYRYYILDEPTISDYEYDMMLKELERLELELFKDYIPSSPTVVVGALEEWDVYV